METVKRCEDCGTEFEPESEDQDICEDCYAEQNEDEDIEDSDDDEYDSGL